MATLWTSLGIIVISLIITIAINMKATMLQTRAGYRACANKRIEIAEHLRYLPIGWFNDNSLGEVTSVTTNTMENMANVATPRRHGHDPRLSDLRHHRSDDVPL